MPGRESFFDDGWFDFLSVMLALHHFDVIPILVIVGRNGFLKAMLLHDRFFGAFPFHKFLIKVEANGYVVKGEGEGWDVGLDFEFILNLFFELFDDHRARGVLLLVFRSGEVFGAEVFVIEGWDKITFGIFTIRLDVIDKWFGVSLVSLVCI